MDHFHSDYFHLPDGDSEDISDELSFDPTMRRVRTHAEPVRVPRAEPVHNVQQALPVAPPVAPPSTQPNRGKKMIDGCQNQGDVVAPFNGIVLTYNQILFVMFVMLVVLIVDSISVNRELARLSRSTGHVNPSNPSNHG